MKKILLLLFGLFLLTGCSNYSNIETISYNDLKEKIENKESFIVIFTNNEVSTEDGNEYDYKSECKVLESTLNSVLVENNLNAYEVVYSKLTQDEKNELAPTIYIENYGIVFVKNGVDSSILTHITDYQTTKYDIKSRLINNAFITENTED